MAQLAELGLVVADDRHHELVAAMSHLVLDTTNHTLDTFGVLAHGEGIDVAVEQLALAIVFSGSQGILVQYAFALVVGLLVHNVTQVAGFLERGEGTHKIVVTMALALVLDEAGARRRGADVAATVVAHLARVAHAKVAVIIVLRYTDVESLGHLDPFEWQ